MNKLVTGMVLGILIKCVWDGQYGERVRQSVRRKRDRLLGKVDNAIIAAEVKIENAAQKVDQFLGKE